jgi:hypothetical protein
LNAIAHAAVAISKACAVNSWRRHQGLLKVVSVAQGRIAPGKITGVPEFRTLLPAEQDDYQKENARHCRAFLTNFFFDQFISQVLRSGA